MSADATGYVFRYSPHSGATFAVHLAVADSVNDQHEQRFWMSQGKTAVKARTSRKTVNEALARLVDDGFLKRLGKGPGDTVAFEFLFPEVPVVYESRSADVSRGVTPACNETLQGVSPDVTGGVTRGDTNPREPKLKREGGRKRRASLPPDDYEPTDANRILAAELGLDLDAERLAWIDSARSKGRTYSDHGRAFSLWLRRAPKFGAARPVLDLEPASGPSLSIVEQAPRPVGVYVCPSGLGCANGWTVDLEGERTGARCACVTHKAGAA